MVRVSFTDNLRRHVDVDTVDVEGDTVSRVLSSVFAAHPRLRGYVLDDQGVLRKHVNVFVGSVRIGDRITLSDPVSDGDDVFVMQALSGG